MSAEEMINNIIHEALSYGYHTAKDELKGGISNGYGKRFRQTFLKEIKELMEAYRNQDDDKYSDEEFVEKMIEELPEFGIDTSMWEYNYGDCCDSAMEFISRAIKGETDYEEVFDDHKRLVRELDVIINGENAAQQASLCDIVAQLKKEHTQTETKEDYYKHLYYELKKKVDQDDRIQKAISFCENNLNELKNFKLPVFASHIAGKYEAYQEIKQLLKSLNPLQ